MPSPSWSKPPPLTCVCILVHSVIRVEAWVLGLPPTPTDTFSKETLICCFPFSSQSTSSSAKKTRLVHFFWQSGCSWKYTGPSLPLPSSLKGTGGSTLHKMLEIIYQVLLEAPSPHVSPLPTPAFSASSFNLASLPETFLDIYFIGMLFWSWQTSDQKGKLLNELFEWPFPSS